MTNSNFDIHNLINKADTKDRAVIFFDELLNMSILSKRKFSDTEIDALSDSFRGNGDANLFNTLLQQCMYSLLMIAQVEKEILKIEFIATHLRFYFLTTDDRFLIETLISGTSKDLQKNKTASDKKEIMKAFKFISDRIEQMCFLAFGENAIKKLVDNLYNSEKEERDWDFYEEMFVKFLQIKSPTESTVPRSF